MRQLTGQEAVKLHQELEVHIVALGSLAVRVPLVVLAQIDTCKRGRPQSASWSGMLIWPLDWIKRALSGAATGATLVREDTLSPAADATLARNVECHGSQRETVS